MTRLVKLLMCAALVALLAFPLMLTGCGDESDLEDPTLNYPDGGSRDEQACKDACDKIAGCIGGDQSDFLEDCKRQCNTATYFDREALDCIDDAGCDAIFSCGFEY